jgi:glycosyltransferase involved in cell wall biosynthesis
MHDLLKMITLRYLPVSFLRRHFTKTITKADPIINANKQLLVDVSVIAQSDAKTGIQRVVRHHYQELLAAAPKGYQVRAIAALRQQPYYYLPTNFLSQPINYLTKTSKELVHVHHGDIFLALDLSAHIIPHRLLDLLRWKQQGVKFSFIVYDLLPVLKRSWFNKRTTQNFKRWLRAIAILANDVITISHTVKTEFTDWMQQHYKSSLPFISCNNIQLGSDISTSDPMQTQPAQLHQLPKQLTNTPFILMVGTIEPRKGYADVIEAFEQLWAKGEKIQLVIAGKQGWKVKSLMNNLQNHVELNNKLHWINGPTDKTLIALYQHCSGLIMASKGEGFGLPIIEAARYQKPLLIRDIPVFKETAGQSASYFTDHGHNNLLNKLPQWLRHINAKYDINQPHPIWPSWQESSAQLLNIIVKNQTKYHKKPLLCPTQV